MEKPDIISSLEENSIIRDRLTLPLVVCFFLVVILYSLTPIRSDDIWWHLSTGKYIIQNWTIPSTDVFSYTAYGKPWITHEWLAQCIFYIIYAALSIDGLIIAKVIIVTFTFHFLLKTCEISNLHRPLCIILLLLALLISENRFVVRPQIFSYLLFSCYLFIIFRYKYRGKDSLNYLPLLQILWANLHGGHILGIGVTGIFAVGEFIESLRHKKGALSLRVVLKNRLLIIALLLVIASLVGPNSYLSILHAFRFTADEFTEATLNEWMPIHQILYETYIPYFFVLLIAGALLLLIDVRNFDLSRYLLFCILAYLPFLAHRHRVIFSFAAVAVLSFALRHIIKDKILRTDYLLYPMLFIVLFSYGYNRIPDLYFGPKRSLYPEGAVEFLRDHPIKGNIFNEYTFGGYIMWELFPHYRVFIDGRGRTFLYEDILVSDYGTILGRGEGFESLISSYDIALFILNYPSEKDRQRDINFIHDFLAESDDWRLLYWDDIALIYIRNEEDYSSLIDTYQFKYVNPLGSRVYANRPEDMEVHLSDIVQEVKRCIAEHPEHTRPRMILGYILTVNKRYAEAFEQYKEVLKIEPGHPGALNNLRWISDNLTIQR